MPRGGDKGDNENGSDHGLSRLSFEHPIPQKVRYYGRVIDPALLELGDLILVSKKQRPWISQKIVDYQGALFNAEHARWHHAAVSGGRFEICEATLSGVRATEYWQYMTGEYDLKIRRLKNAPAAVRSQIAYFAATNVGINYGFLNLLNISQVLKSGDSWRRPMLQLSMGVICSQLYFEACMRAGYLLVNMPAAAVCPAHLSMSSLMEDVPLSWVSVQ